MKVLVTLLFPFFMNNDSSINARIDSWKYNYDKLNFYKRAIPAKLNVNDLCMFMIPIDSMPISKRMVVGVVLQKFGESILMQTYSESEMYESAKATMLLNIQYSQLYVLRKKWLDEQD